MMKYIYTNIFLFSITIEINITTICNPKREKRQKNIWRSCFVVYVDTVVKTCNAKNSDPRDITSNGLHLLFKLY